MRTRLAALGLIVVVASALPADAGPGLPPSGPAPPTVTTLPFLPPVDGAVGRRFVAPGTDWGPGHRGIDYSVAPGTSVRAAAAGDVTFAGSVGNLRAVTVAHADNLETTYSSLDEIFVSAGDRVTAGSWLGTTAASHPGADGGLHFGVKHLGRYVDPERHLGALDLAGAIYLVPDHHVHTGKLARRYNPQPLDDGSRDCTRLRLVPPGAPPPSDNVAVVIAGHNTSADAPVFAVPTRLGYSRRDVYRFSYRGLDGPRLFESYDRSDTYRDLSVHALRLRRLLVEVGRRHPGRGVDVFAHSQGGLIARHALTSFVDEWDPSLPQVEHLVTYSTPHEGTRLADAPEILADGDAGFLLLDAAEALGIGGARARSVEQMRPASPYLAALRRADIALGTRVLALSIPNDLLVPAHRAAWDGELSRTVPAAGLSGHGKITSSADADGVVYGFLRGAPDPCDLADATGRAAGRIVSGAHRVAPWLLRWAEETGKVMASRHPVGRVAVEVLEGVAKLRRGR